MISARKFCQQPGYPITIFLTYSFDPLFFERVPLDDLSVGGSRRILVLADAREIAESMKRCAGQVFYLGRTYTLAEAKASSLFHPKMIARLSPNGGQVWVGSGNLTYTGWGGNHELATTWSIGPDTDDAGTWLLDVLRSVTAMTSSESFRTQLEIVRSSIAWLGTSGDKAAPGPVLLGMPNRPLATQLAQRWEGRRFTAIKIYTGSTDVDGAFLLWAHKTFGVERATVCLTPSFASFEAKQLAKLPLKVRFVERDPKRRVHAKLYWFSGPDGDAAVMGSANCSAAAWLVNHDNGNVELITVYDRPERAAFAPILSDFNGEEFLSKDVLVAPVKPIEPPGNEDADQVYRMTSIRLRASGRTIEAVVEPTLVAEDATMVIEAKRDLFRVPMKLFNKRWVGRLSEKMSIGVEPLFATMEISSGSGLIVTPPRWIDNERAIENAARDRHVDPNHEVFSGLGFGGASEQRIMEAIYAISSSLLNFETTAPSTLPKDRAGAPKPETNAASDDEPVRPVDPSTLTYSLNEHVGKSGHRMSDGGIHGVSLRGVMKLLFATEDEPEIDLSRERWSADEPEKYTPDDEPKNDIENSIQRPAPKSDTGALAALREQVDQFLSKLAKPSFAEGCPASILAQALVFPILLGIKGNEEGWLPDDALASIACRVAQLMFTKRYGRDKPIGLFRQVQTRYAADDKNAEFLKSVGDGALYTVLLAALAKPVALSIATLVVQADAIAHVMNCPELVALSDPEQRAILMHSVLIRDAAFAIGERAGMLAAAQKTLTSRLQEWDRVNAGRASRSTLQRAGTVLWSTYGWEVTPQTPAETYCSGVNLDTAARDSADIQVALEELWTASKIRRVSNDAKTEEASL